jgi:hypothetical protein
MNNKIITKIARKNKEIDITKGIQRGEVTHHHDQLIFFVSLRTKNIKNNKLDNPIPEDVFFDAILNYT